MTTKKNYQVEFPAVGDDATTPFIYEVEEEDTGMIWRDAKKALRQWFLDQAQALRTYTESDFQTAQAELQADIADAEVFPDAVKAAKVEANEPVSDTSA